MRVSTSMIYEKGIAAIQRQTAELLHTQQQVSSGRRILTPADDPIAAARALEIDQSKAVNAQFTTNQGTAEDRLRVVENRLVGVGEVLQYARERAVQAGSAALSETELGFIATDMRAQFDALMALANSQDAQGEYLFAGYKANSIPFEGGIGGVIYNGDQGNQTIQVASSRYMEVSFAGSEVFDRTRRLADSVSVVPAPANGGGAQLASTSPAPQGVRYEIEWDGSAYSAIRRAPGTPDQTLVVIPTGAPPTSISFDGGVTLSITGAPAAGDRFEVFSASTNLFENFALFIDALERPGAGGVTNGAVTFALENLDAALDNVLRVRAQIGSQLVELDGLGLVGSDLDLQYAQTLSRLQDVDYAEAISRLTQQQTFLEAAQLSYLRVTGLSLFNFLS